MVTARVRVGQHTASKAYRNWYTNFVPDALPLVFWQSATGREPVREWLKALDLNDKKVVGRDLAKVQYGWPIGLPLCRALADGLWEVRCSLPSRREGRVILCFRDQRLVALHAFFKSSRTMPKTDLDLAKTRMRDLG